MMDVVVPQGNERELIAMAERLGWTGLVLAYEPGRLPEKLPATKLHLAKAVLIRAPDVRKWKGRAVTIVRAEPGQERQAVESGADLVIRLEDAPQKDAMHARVSGLNQVLVRLAKRHGTAIGISLADLLGVSGMHRARLLGRIAQNIALCEKAGTRVALASFARTPDGMRGPYDLLAVGRVLGMTPEQARKAAEGF